MERPTTPAQSDPVVNRSNSDGTFGLETVRRALSGLRYGEVRVIVQDGVIVQIERVEKQRIR